ncbi:MAG: HlyC/CorC family transporter [Acidobacteria bacterium]|nr:MAG: HlyC/CorC family transporter [Acidobacteriota bacterium]
MIGTEGTLTVIQGLGVLFWFLATILAIVLSILLERSSPIRLRHWAEEGGGRLLELYDRPARFEVFRFLFSWVAKIVPFALFFSMRRLFLALGSTRATLWSVVVVLLVLAASELLGRWLVQRDPERALRRLTKVYRVILFFLLPGVAVLTPLFPTSAVERVEDEDGVTEDEIEAFIDVGTKEGILDPGEEELIMGVIDFGDTLVRSVVTPRIDIVCASVDSDMDELADLFLSSKHSRIPIYQESVDHIVGVLHIRDLLRGQRSTIPMALEDLAMPPYFVPETKPLNELLREFQEQRQQIAIVVDEYGGTAGIVTVEDLLEEIVGEIEDEHDEAAPVQEALPDGSWRIDGRESLELLDELFDVDIEQEPFETVGGLIFGRLGSVPRPGEAVESHGLRLMVERIDGRRIRSVLVEKLAAGGEEKGE